MLAKRSLAVLGLTLAGLLLLVALGTRHYGGNVSALLHMDARFGRLHEVPSGLVLYEDAGYDGMLYYQITRDLAAVLPGHTPSFDSPYRYQRILLPLLAYTVSLGRERAFPVALLSINIACALGSLALALALTKRRALHALTVALNPAVLVGILFSLTEPLSLFFIVLFFFLWERAGKKLTTGTLAALLLSLLARETTVFLIGLLFLWFLWKREWRQAVLIVMPLFLFTLWQTYLAQHFGSIAFQANSNIVAFPFWGPFTVFRWLSEGKKVTYVLSSIALMSFVFPLMFALGREWVRERTRIGVLAFLLGGLTVTMLSMDEHMWGVITSIGRIVTPIYPVYALYADARDTWVERSLSAILIVVSVAAAIGIASVPHPFVLS